MKKLLFLVSLLLGFAACNSEEENENLVEVEVIDYTSEIANMIAEIGDYDVNSVASLLCGAEGWNQEIFLKYDEGWNSTLEDWTTLDGGATRRYKFYADGKLDDFTKPTYPPLDIELPRVKSWAFDPETRTLTIGSTNYHLTALGEETLILDYIDTWSAAYPHYLRLVFKARAIE